MLQLALVVVFPRIHSLLLKKKLFDAFWEVYILIQDLCIYEDVLYSLVRLTVQNKGFESLIGETLNDIWILRQTLISSLCFCCLNAKALTV